MNELRPYQQAAVTAMVRDRRKYLAFAPRMGKTPTTITAANKLGVVCPLVICPAIARDVWHEHWRTWGLAAARPTVVSYERAVRGLEEIAQYDAVIVDEVHYAAHVTAQRTKAALAVANRAPNAKLLAMLSGSPVRRRPFDLYPVLRAVWPDVLKRYGVMRADLFRAAFEEEVYVPSAARPFQPTRTAPKNVPMLRALLDGIMIRTTRGEVAEQLPPVAWEVQAIALPPEAADTLRRMLLTIPELPDIASALEAGELPGQHAGAQATVRRLLGIAKAATAGHIIDEELEAGLLTQVVVGAYHRDVLDTLQSLLPQDTVRIDGSTPPYARAQAIADFQRGVSRVMLAQLSAAGVGIDLSAADDLILVEQDWDPQMNLQFADRIRSPNKERPCTVREIVVRGSIDQQVAGVRRRKLRVAGQIVYGDD